jgi:hypothetical protein
MKILRAIGLGLTIIMFKFLIPHLFAGFESTLLVFFDTLQTILGSAKNLAQVPAIP